MSTPPATKKLTVYRRHVIRQLLHRGEVEEAGIRAAKWGIDIEDVKLTSNAFVPAEFAKPLDKELEEAISIKAPPPPELPTSPTAPSIPAINRWPAEVDLVVEGQPINKRMVLARLPDRRQVMMWKRNGQYPINCKVKARLCDQVGTDAYYEPAASF